MQTILIGTQNKTKLQEIYSAFDAFPHKFKLVSLLDLGIKTEPEETGKTFKENALLKATYYSDLTGLPTLADDGGPEIDALNGEPGVKSKLWLDRPATDEELIEYTLERMKGVPYEKRTMQMTIWLSFHNPKTSKILYSNDAIKAHIAEVPTQNYRNGFPWRALMFIETYKKFYDELTAEEHYKINHRWHALKTIIPKIQESI